MKHTKAYVLERQRLYRLNNNNLYTHKYEKTKAGFLVRKYRNMLSRVAGIQKLKSHLYLNKEILSKDEFKKWANDNLEFHRLFKLWEDSGYERKVCPSVDRIDSSKGYTTDNMEWITHSENSRRGVNSRYKKVNNE